MISPWKEITQTVSSLSGNSSGITLGGWIYLGVIAAWMASIYIFALRDYKAQQKAEEGRQRELLQSPPLNPETKKE